jgi:hypothetical protein
MAELEPIQQDVRPRMHRVLRMVFFGVVMPIAILTLLGIGYLVFELGVEHY